VGAAPLPPPVVVEPPPPPPDPALLADALQRVASLEDEGRREVCYVTLMKVLGNIHASPTEGKFRRLPLTSPKLMASVLDIPGGRDVLHAAGFTVDEDSLCLLAAITSVEAALGDVRASAEKLVMDRMRRERDEKIQLAKEKAGQKILGKGRKLDPDMLETLARAKQDQQDLDYRRNK